uniref:hypothetical protein n=1 Tax=uncultured Acidovorax sp. TaxID=158751 RepID=UPI000ABA1709|nr:hypothetical protein [uncultured Acidovorax sp.]
MKSLSNYLIAIGIAVAAFGSNVNAQSNDIIYSELKPSDKPIIIDLVSHRLPKDRGSKCPNTDLCQYVLSEWEMGLSQETEGRKYLQALDNKPPHIRNQILAADFSKRYEQLSSQKNNNICIDNPRWEAFNSKSGYFFGEKKNFPGDFDFFIQESPFSGSLILRDNQKLLQKVPNEFITEDVFLKLKNLLNQERFMRFCGKATASFDYQKYVNRKVDFSEIMQRGGVGIIIFEFTVERPIEFFKKGDKKPTLTIPLAWFK